MFATGQKVRGVVCGSFVVVKSKRSDITGSVIVTVREIGPCGEVSRNKMNFISDVLVSAE
ncbi:hypothetical protein UFOVP1004_27 [uncultured Caudovirales phage]|uniref:Uncharacterized protein n=1 Tax=uncultured Caudovirales phage TaxID=2100421 RepID=A0A6J5Q8I0_9CAUD|nr:hypothetical protein UFOVP1004_27 [uncultured Caudovirales phage]